MKPTQQEARLFLQLSQSGEGVIINAWIESKLQHLVAEMIDKGEATEADIAGVKLARKALTDLTEHLVERAIMGEEIESFS